MDPKMRELIEAAEQRACHAETENESLRKKLSDLEAPSRALSAALATIDGLNLRMGADGIPERDEHDERGAPELIYAAVSLIADMASRCHAEAVTAPQAPK
jgi:hypothetical protein